MKKLVIAAIIASVASLATAAEMGIEYKDYGFDGTGTDAKAYSLSVAGNVAPGVKLDAKIQNKQEDVSKALSTRLETGLTGSVPVAGSLSAYTRVAVGEKFTNSDNFSFYSVEPGIAVKQNGVGVSLGYRFRDAFSSSHNDQSRTWRAKLGYDLTKQDNVYVGYDRSRGDSDYNAWKVGYVRSF